MTRAPRSARPASDPAEANSPRDPATPPIAGEIGPWSNDVGENPGEMAGTSPIRESATVIHGICADLSRAVPRIACPAEARRNFAAAPLAAHLALPVSAGRDLPTGSA